jgi:thiol-disulfide isomerase/thioredoxin
MFRSSRRSSAIATLVNTLLVVTSTSADDRSADEVLKDYRSVVVPKPDAPRGRTARAVREARARRRMAIARRDALALELYRAHPGHERVAELMATRWGDLLANPNAATGLGAEIEQVLATARNESLIKEASFVKATLELRGGDRGPDAALAAVEDFIRRDPKDERGAMLLFDVAGRVSDHAVRDALYRRVADEYRSTPYAGAVKALGDARRGAGSPAQAEAIGKPFRLKFADAVTGMPVSIQTLNGKVVVIDFWATWCPPCVREMPKMIDLYRRYHGQGVEFIGVSLDEPREKGGYDRLVEFVTSNEIPWPQYYQGNGWGSEFSSSWGVNSIPCVFLVDSDGRLVDTNARGKLEELIPRYLGLAKKTGRR